jgi:uncharacterized protein
MGSFEWDDNKNATNRQKHGIGFEEAATIFEGPILTKPDERHQSERREISFGRLGGVVVVCVVHTRRGTSTRIISARKANRAERKLFDEYLQKAAS